METSEKIRLLRQQKAWSQKEMAEKLKMSLNGYAKIERGESRPAIERLQQIAETLGVPLYELLPQNDSNIVFMINDCDNYQSSFYNSTAQNLNHELEKLQAQLAQKDLIIRHQEQMLEQTEKENNLLHTLLATLQQQS